MQKILPRLKKGEDLYPGIIGIGFRSRNVHLEEPVLASVFPDSPAEKAGLKKDDRIVEVDGRPVVRAAQVRQELARRYAGDSVKLLVARGKERFTRQVTLVAKMPAYQRPFLGLLPQRAAEGSGGGLTVRYVYPDGPAAQADLRPGDVIVKLAGHEIDDRGDAAEQLGSQGAGAEVAVEVRREGQKVEAHVKLAALPVALPPRRLPPAHAEHKPASRRARRASFRRTCPRSRQRRVDVRARGPRSGIPAALIIWLHGPGKFDPPVAVEPWNSPAGGMMRSWSCPRRAKRAAGRRPTPRSSAASSRRRPPRITSIRPGWSWPGRKAAARWRTWPLSTTTTKCGPSSPSTGPWPTSRQPPIRSIPWRFSWPAPPAAGPPRPSSRTSPGSVK